MTTGTDYRTGAMHLLEQARVELDRGDTRQASEKGWGAGAQAVKAVAQGRGWEHNTHGDLFRVVRLLAVEPGGYGLDRLFGVANILHVNFYENWLEASTVRAHSDDVAGFVVLMAGVETLNEPTSIGGFP